MTHFNTQQGKDIGYRLQFETDDKDKFLFMQEQARKCIDNRYDDEMEHLWFSQRLYLEEEYYKWKEGVDNKEGYVLLDCPMLVVSFLQDHGYINVSKVLEDWRKENNYASHTS